MMVGSLNLLSIAFAVCSSGSGLISASSSACDTRSERYKKQRSAGGPGQAAEYCAIPLRYRAMATAAGFLSFPAHRLQGRLRTWKDCGRRNAGRLHHQHHAASRAIDLLQSGRRERAARLRISGPRSIIFWKSTASPLSPARWCSLSPACRRFISAVRLQPDQPAQSQGANRSQPSWTCRKDPNTGANAVNVMASNEEAAKQIEARLAKVPECCEPCRSTASCLMSRRQS